MQTAILAPDRAAKARVVQVDHCQEHDFAATESGASLSGWRAGAAAALVALVLVLVAIPVAAALDPALVGQVSRLFAGLAGLTPVTLAARAVVLVVALAVISRPDGKA